VTRYWDCSSEVRPPNCQKIGVGVLMGEYFDLGGTGQRSVRRGGAPSKGKPASSWQPPAVHDMLTVHLACLLSVTAGLGAA
jgi:hypothetical protein